MLIDADDFEAIASGRFDTAFRKWIRPTVKAGGTLTTAAGVLAIDAVDAIALNAVTPEDLKRAGFEARSDLDAMLANREGTLFRIRLRYLGEDPRQALRESSDISGAQADELDQTLGRMDGSAPWVRRTLELIGSQPGLSAQALAQQLEVAPAKLKGNIRRLKALGLTESLAMGYRLSPRGQAWLDRPIASA